MNSSLPDRTEAELREDALAIWQAGVSAVDSVRLVEETVEVSGRRVSVGDWTWSAQPHSRILVVGAGKAGGGMVRGIENLFGDTGFRRFHIDGWVNVPDDCVQATRSIHLHGARPAGLNEPTQRGIDGSNEILRQVGQLGSNDLCICLISGGGSALLPAPRPGVTLKEKQEITRHLAANGADIVELNTIRIALSSIKGGGLAKACHAGSLLTLIISDVLGDPLEMIASGPTIMSTSTTSSDGNAHTAAAIWKRFGDGYTLSEAAAAYIAADRQPLRLNKGQRSHSVVIGNNAVAVDAAGMEAEKRGYSHAMMASPKPEGNVTYVAQHHAKMACRMLTQEGPDCLITGGEPVVELPNSNITGKGGRNQQLVLEATLELMRLREGQGNPLTGLCMVSGGTDGEDGPTDSAGAIVDSSTYGKGVAHRVEWLQAAANCDAYPLWDACGGLIKTGPTHTNVCDIRVVVVARREALPE